ncbi:MAG: heme-binding protein [Planctomycetales bacterium]
MRIQQILLAVFTIFAILMIPGHLLAKGPVPYGPPINLKTAKAVLAAAEAKADENDWAVVIAIVDSGGNLVLLHRLDNTQLGSIEIAQGKAKTAVNFRKSTKDFEDRIANGGADLKLLKLNGLPMEGGLPIIQDGQVVGAIGISGVTSKQDGQIAAAGLEGLEKVETKKE